MHYWTSILRQSMSEHILSSCTTFLLCSMLHLTPFEVSTKVYVRRRSSWRRKSCENIITGSIWIEIKTHMRALHLHALTDWVLSLLSRSSSCDISSDLDKWIQSCSGNMERRIYQNIVVKSKQMQWVRICICSGNQFEDAFENQTTNSTRVAMHTHGKAIWKSI